MRTLLIALFSLCILAQLPSAAAQDLVSGQSASQPSTAAGASEGRFDSRAFHTIPQDISVIVTLFDDRAENLDIKRWFEAELRRAGLTVAEEGALEFAIDNRLSGTYNLVNDISDTKQAFFGRILREAGLDDVTWLGDGTGPKNLSNQKIKDAGYVFLDARAEHDGQSLLGG